jgi:hypothetical protein
MNLMTSVAVYSSIAILVIVALYITLMAWRGALGNERPLLLGEMLRRRGANLPDAITRGPAYDYALAVRRCVNCVTADSCQKWLETNRQDGYAEFCPNAEFIGRLKKPG